MALSEPKLLSKLRSAVVLVASHGCFRHQRALNKSDLKRIVAGESNGI